MRGEGAAPVAYGSQSCRAVHSQSPATPWRGPPPGVDSPGAGRPSSGGGERIHTAVYRNARTTVPVPRYGNFFVEIIHGTALARATSF